MDLFFKDYDKVPTHNMNTYCTGYKICFGKSVWMGIVKRQYSEHMINSLETQILLTQ